MPESRDKKPAKAGAIPPAEAGDRPSAGKAGQRPVEIGGRDGPEPTRYGDWEKAGRCIDF